MMIKRLSLILMFGVFAGCDDNSREVMPDLVIPEGNYAFVGQQFVKVERATTGWVALKERIQPQYAITAPKRTISWMDDRFHEVRSYDPPDGWHLIDAVVHPSGHVSAALVNVDLKRIPLLQVKLLRFNKTGIQFERELTPLPQDGDRIRYFPSSLDRIRLHAFNEDVYAVVRWDHNEITASRFSFVSGLFHQQWQTLVEPDAYCGFFGIIGGGYDNFHQGDRYSFVYCDVDIDGSLYVAVQSHEELLADHDRVFGENLSAGADPANYQFGVAILSKLTSDGARVYARLEGHSRQVRLLNMNVDHGSIYFTGRIKKNSDPNGWDAWILHADPQTGAERYDVNLDLKNGDMFWSAAPLPDGRVVAVGSNDYTQNPAGLSVSDSRAAIAVLLNGQGQLVESYTLPQGPTARGSEAIDVRIVGSTLVVAGAHNAPGTHAEVYSDGFIATIALDSQK